MHHEALLFQQMAVDVSTSPHQPAIWVQLGHAANRPSHLLSRWRLRNRHAQPRELLCPGHGQLLLPFSIQHLNSLVCLHPVNLPQELGGQRKPAVGLGQEERRQFNAGGQSMLVCHCIITA